MKTFNYTQSKLLSLKSYNAKVKEDLAYHQNMKGEWKNFNGANPYLEHYGDDWEAHMKDSPKMRPYK